MKSAIQTWEQGSTRLPPSSRTGIFSHFLLMDNPVQLSVPDAIICSKSGNRQDIFQGGRCLRFAARRWLASHALWSCNVALSSTVLIGKRCPLGWLGLKLLPASAVCHGLKVTSTFLIFTRMSINWEHRIIIIKLMRNSVIKQPWKKNYLSNPSWNFISIWFKYPFNRSKQKSY